MLSKLAKATIATNLLLVQGGCTLGEDPDRTSSAVETLCLPSERVDPEREVAITNGDDFYWPPEASATMKPLWEVAPGTGAGVHNDPEECQGQTYYRVTGVDTTRWGVNLNIRFAQMVDLRAYAGLSFWARTDLPAMRVPFSVVTTATEPPPATAGDAGTLQDPAACNAGIPADAQNPNQGCYDHYGVEVQVSQQWRKYEVRFERMSQSGFGRPAEFRLREVMAITWGLPRQASYDLAVADVSLIR